MLPSRISSSMLAHRGQSVIRSTRTATRQWAPSPLQCPRRAVHFLPFLGLWGAKHLTSWTIYNACKSYGWPRVYRRLLEQNRVVNNRNGPLCSPTQQALRMAIEKPPQFAALFAHQYEQLLLPLIQKVAAAAEPKLPAFLVAIAKFIVNSQRPIKIIQDFVGAAATKAKRP